MDALYHRLKQHRTDSSLCQAGKSVGMIDPSCDVLELHSAGDGSVKEGRVLFFVPELRTASVDHF
jgi:hypothetical protein